MTIIFVEFPHVPNDGKPVRFANGLVESCDTVILNLEKILEFAKCKRELTIEQPLRKDGELGTETLKREFEMTRVSTDDGYYYIPIMLENIRETLRNLSSQTDGVSFFVTNVRKKAEKPNEDILDMEDETRL